MTEQDLDAKPKKPMEITVISAQSESGDDYGPWLFLKEPSQKRLEAFLRERVPGEFLEEDEAEDVPGEFGSFLHISISKATVEK